MIRNELTLHLFCDRCTDNTSSVYFWYSGGWWKCETCEGNFELQINLEAPHNLSFCQTHTQLWPPIHLQSHPISLKTEQENETRSGLGLWTIKWPQQLWTAPTFQPPKTLWITPITPESDFPLCVGTPQTGYKYEQRSEFMLLLPHCQIWPPCSIPEASSESAKPTLTNSSQPG